MVLSSTPQVLAFWDLIENGFSTMHPFRRPLPRPSLYIYKNMAGARGPGGSGASSKRIRYLVRTMYGDCPNMVGKDEHC